MRVHDFLTTFGIINCIRSKPQKNGDDEAIEPSGLPPDEYPRLVVGRVVGVEGVTHRWEEEVIDDDVSESGRRKAWEGGGGSKKRKKIKNAGERTGRAEVVAKAVVNNAVGDGTVGGGCTIDWNGVINEVSAAAAGGGDQTPAVDIEECKRIFEDICTGGGEGESGIASVVNRLSPNVLSAAIAAASKEIPDSPSDTHAAGVIAAARSAAVSISDETAVRDVVLRAELLNAKVRQIEERLNRIREVERVVEVERMKGY